MKMSGLPVETILEAGNGLEALEILGREDVQLLLTDINMPGMNGEELIRTLSQSGKIQTLPVIVVSTDGTVPRREVLTSLGARGYLEKPFQPEQLREQVERILEVEIAD
jgi:two-component system chemotaxis response regulator CheY